MGAEGAQRGGGARTDTARETGARAAAMRGQPACNKRSSAAHPGDVKLPERESGRGGSHQMKPAHSVRSVLMHFPIQLVSRLPSQLLQVTMWFL